MRTHFSLIVSFLLLAASLAFANPKVTLQRVPESGIQPQVAVDATGAVHLIFFKGEEGHGDVYYVKSTDGGESWSTSIRVNSQLGAVIAIGSVRGAHLAIGRNGRAHVAWMGSQQAEPKPPGTKQAPMLYTRMNDACTAFEPQRNVLTERGGLDGGASVAADDAGHVLVAWHAPPKLNAGEANRTIWIARSSDEGRTFAPETQAFPDPTGACGCCGMRIAMDAKGATYILYRSATEMVHRDIYLLMSPGPGQPFVGKDIGPWNIGKCVMSTASIERGPVDALIAWEQEDQVYWATANADRAEVGQRIPAPGKGNNRKHPRAVQNANGDVLLAWTEGTGWQKGGKLAWQVFGKEGQVRVGESGIVAGIPVWSFPAVFTRGDEFVILY